MEDAAEPTPGADGAETENNTSSTASRRAKDSRTPRRTRRRTPRRGRAAGGREGHRGSVVRRGRVAAEAAKTLLVDNLEPLARHALKYGELVVSKGSVLDAHVGALVNAANEGCQGGGGVDGAITSAGGDLRSRRSARRCRASRAATGGAARRATRWLPAGGPFGSLRCDVCDSRRRAELPVCSPTARATSWSGATRSAVRLRREYGARQGRAVQDRRLFAAVGGHLRGRQSLDTILAISVGAVADGAYEGRERVHLVAFTPAEQRKLKAAAATAAVRGARARRRRWTLVRRRPSSRPGRTTMATASA